VSSGDGRPTSAMEEVKGGGTVERCEVGRMRRGSVGLEGARWRRNYSRARSYAAQPWHPHLCSWTEGKEGDGKGESEREMRETKGGARVIHIDECGDTWIRGGGHASCEGERGGEQWRMPGHAALLSVHGVDTIRQISNFQFYLKHTTETHTSCLCNS
jgi:hypothetical protein